MIKYEPMLATNSHNYNITKGYTFEPKYDGIRCIAYLENNKQTFVNRSMNDVTDKFPEIEIESKFNNLVIDGELVCLNAQGIPDFQLMQRRMNRKSDIAKNAQEYPATFVAFDIILEPPEFNFPTTYLYRRSQLLLRLMPNEHVIIAPNYTDFHETTELYKNWEGLVAKKNNSYYVPGVRSKDWIKLKNRKTEIFHIYGATQGLGRRADYFGALIVGYVDKETDLLTLSEVGTGFTDQDLVILTQLLSTSEKSLRSRARYSFNRPLAYWTTPVHKCKVSFLEKTSSGELRQGSFERLVE